MRLIGVGTACLLMRSLAWAALAAARELAAADDPSVGDEEIRWVIEHASPAVREVVRRYPVRVPGRSRLDALYYQLDAGLRR